MEKFDEYWKLYTEQNNITIDYRHTWYTVPGEVSTCRSFKKLQNFTLNTALFYY